MSHRDIFILYGQGGGGGECPPPEDGYYEDGEKVPVPDGNWVDNVNTGPPAPVTVIKASYTDAPPYMSAEWMWQGLEIMGKGVEGLPTVRPSGDDITVY